MTKKNSDNSEGSGNTVNAAPNSKKQGTEAVNWLFTFNNYEESDIARLESIFNSECKLYVFQEETGENGTPHLQGVISLLGRGQRLSALKKWDPSIHWEKCRSLNNSIKYCCKLETRTGNVYFKNIKPSLIKDTIEVEEPYGWQLVVTDIIEKKPDKRSIHWFVDERGNMGKSTLCKYLVVKHNALLLNGKCNDMFHMLSKHDNKKLILVDIPRCTQEFRIDYGAIEQIKNGLMFSGKYEGSQIVFNCPHVIVFSNNYPDTSKMSSDRWKIYKIRNSQQVKLVDDYKDDTIKNNDDFINKINVDHYNIGDDSDDSDNDNTGYPNFSKLNEINLIL